MWKYLDGVSQPKTDPFNPKKCIHCFKNFSQVQSCRNHQKFCGANPANQIGSKPTSNTNAQCEEEKKQEQQDVGDLICDVPESAAKTDQRKGQKLIKERVNEEFEIIPNEDAKNEHPENIESGSDSSSDTPTESGNDDSDTSTDEPLVRPQFRKQKA